MKFEAIYSRLPLSLQNLACSCYGVKQYGLRYGHDFKRILNWLEESQWWSEDEIRDFQDVNLRMIVRHAYETVPFYHKKFDEMGLDPSAVQGVADLYRLPILTKEDIRGHANELLSTAFSKRTLVYSHTSGTTGKSLQFYMPRAAVRFRWAVWWRHRKRFGVDFNSSYADFTGLPAVPLTQRDPPFWRENRVMNQTVFTMHHMVPSKVKPIVERLNMGTFDYYSGYPSIIFVLANLIREAGLDIKSPPKVIFTGAENLYEEQRKLISEVFQCPVTDQYGFSEGCGNASRCKQDLFHEDFEYGILECVDSDGRTGLAQQGRIVATGFSNYAMPFLRYDVGDVGTWETEECSCGRKSKTLSKIDGRAEDYVITPEGQRIMRFDYIFKDAHNVQEAQVLQKKLGEIILRIKRRSAYCVKDENFLREMIGEMVSPTIDVAFEYVQEIEREPNGKFKAVKSTLQ